MMNATVPDAEENRPSEVPGEASAAEVGEKPAESHAEENRPAEVLSAEPGAEENDPVELQERPAEPPMAWHRFLTGFGLWLEALCHAFQAGWMLWGGQYYGAENRAIAYAGLPAMRALDWALAAVAAAAALLCVLSAMKLRKWRSAGPVLLRWTYRLLLAGQLGLAAGRYFIIGLTPLAASTLGPMSVYLALLLVNGSYYRRRRGCLSPRG